MDCIKEFLQIRMLHVHHIIQYYSDKGSRVAWTSKCMNAGCRDLLFIRSRKHI